MTNTFLEIRGLIPALAFALLGLAATGCERDLVSAIDDGRGGSSGSAGSGGSAGAGVVCETPVGSRLYTDTTAEITDAVKGKWVRCGHALTSDESEVGLEVADDLHFWVLVRGADGSVVRSTSLFGSGQVVVTPLAMSNGHRNFDVDFATDANLAYRLTPLFTTDEPRKMVTTNTDIFWQIYVHGDPSEVVGGTSGSAGSAGTSGSAGSSGGAGSGGGGSGVCATPIGSRLQTASTAEIIDAVKGKWVRCGHALTSDDSEVGLEVADDLHFWVLVPGPNGSIVRSTSLFGSGQVVVVTASTTEFATDANLTYQLSPFFTTDAPRKMVTTNTDIFWQIYVHEDP